MKIFRGMYNDEEGNCYVRRADTVARFSADEGKKFVKYANIKKEEESMFLNNRRFTYSRDTCFWCCRRDNVYSKDYRRVQKEFRDNQSSVVKIIRTVEKIEPDKNFCSYMNNNHDDDDDAW